MRHRLARAFSAPCASTGASLRRVPVLLGALVLSIVTAVAVVPAAASGARARSTTPFPTGQVTFAGHGWGPALGMGQWGAFGYAAEYHRTFQWILSHFYGGTTLVRGGKDPIVKVAITENLGFPVAITSPSSFRYGTVTVPAGTAARAILNPTTGTWRISEASSCAQPSKDWKIVVRSIADPVAIPSSLQLEAPLHDLLTICRGDGVAMTVRGRVEAYDNAGGMRTLNLLRLEQYIADVTPSESSSGWADYGGAGPQGEPWGFQSLEAQAVAARTFTLAYEAGGGWYGYADICDTGCQSYPGVLNENSVATLAATDTAGTTLDLSGAPAPTEYSASTGGYTVNDSTWAGTVPFTPVQDLGDAVCLKTSGWTCNTDHSWTGSVAVTTIEATWPSIGTLTSVKVTARYGSTKSAYGGRVATIEVVGAKGTVKVAGYTWAGDFGFLSDWFAVTDGPGATSTPPASGSAHGARSGSLSVPSWRSPTGRFRAPALFQPTGGLPSRRAGGRSAHLLPGTVSGLQG